MIIQMGNNGPLYGEDMEAICSKATSEVGQLFLIDDHAPVSWIDESNHALAEAARGLAAHDADRLGSRSRPPTKTCSGTAST